MTLGASYDCMKYMGHLATWVTNNWLHNQNKSEHNETLGTDLGLNCIIRNRVPSGETYKPGQALHNYIPLDHELYDTLNVPKAKLWNRFPRMKINGCMMSSGASVTPYGHVMTKTPVYAFLDLCEWNAPATAINGKAHHFANEILIRT